MSQKESTYVALSQSLEGTGRQRSLAALELARQSADLVAVPKRNAYG